MGAELMERRKDPRAEHEEETKIKLLGDEKSVGFGYEVVQTRNVSKSGACVMLPYMVKEGNVVRVEIPVENGTTFRHIKAFCEVQWCRQSKESPGNFEAGLSFIAVKDEDAEYLNHYVSNNRAV